MLLRSLIRVPKTITKPGKWAVVTRVATMPETAFRLSLGHPIQLGRHFHWRVDELEWGTHSFKLLTGFYRDKAQFLANLGLIRGKNDMPIVARLEFHGTHPGWHVHIADCPINELESDDATHRYCKRYPAGQSRRKEYVVQDDEAAEYIAFRFFRVQTERTLFSDYMK